MSARRRYGSTTVSCDVDVDLGEVVADLNDDDILAECALRGIATGLVATEAVKEQAMDWRDFADDLRRVMASGDRMHMEVLIIRMLMMARVPSMKLPDKAYT
jgi:hypothetical protein